MSKIAVINISKESVKIARLLQSDLGAKSISRSQVGKNWKDFDVFIFVGAMGICVRTIAPFIKDKHEDPAVLCVDGMGKNVISVLSGHVGGANEWTRLVSAVLGANPVITTLSDNAGLWALDTLSNRFNWPIASEDDMNACIFAFVNRKPTALFLEVRDEGTEYLESTLPSHVTIVDDLSEVTAQKYKLVIMVTPFSKPYINGVLTLHFVPMVGTIGFGLAHHPDDYEQIYDQMDEAIAMQGLKMRDMKWNSSLPNN